MRLNLATDLKVRTGAPDGKDARMTNCYVEVKGQDAIVRKRPGLIDLTTTVVCVGQGGIETRNGAVFFNCDKISTAVVATDDYTILDTDVIVDVCGDVVLTMPAVPRPDQTIAITNICEGVVTIPDLPVTVSIEPMIFGVSYDAFAVGTAYKWTESGGFVELPVNVILVCGASANGNEIAGNYLDLSSGNIQYIEEDDDQNIVLAGADAVRPVAISADGIVVCGFADMTAGGLHAFVWTDADGAIDITPAATNASADSVSDDGLTVLVRADGVNYTWTSAGGLVSLGLPGGYDAYYISGDGNVVIGFLEEIGGGFVYNRTTAATTVISGEIPESCSKDGSIIVSSPVGEAHITLRSPSGNTVINPLTGYHFFDGYYLSADGTIIAASCAKNSGERTGVIWTAASGLVDFGGVGSYYQNNVGAVAGGNVTLTLTADIKTGTQVGQIVPSTPAATAKPTGVVPIPSYGARMISETRSSGVGYTWSIGGSYYTAYSDGTYSIIY